MYSAVVVAKRMKRARKCAMWQESWSKHAPEWVMRRGLEACELKWTLLGKPIWTYYSGK